MSGSIFLTGASGYIGRNLIQNLDSLSFDRAYCLCRDQNGLRNSIKSNKKIQIVCGGLNDTAAYAPYLAECDTVIHLAAVTGKASKQEYFKVNAESVENFITQCKKAGIRNFLHVSTIAVKYPDKRYYYYAQSKERGECIVKASGLNYIIVRPTIVIGKESVIWTSLSKIAKAPIIPLLGSKSVRIQPIYVDDLIELLLSILEEDLFVNETIELGGPDEVSFESFLRKIHFEYSQKESRMVWLPLTLLKTMLSVLETRFLQFLPFTAGQLSAFSNNGTIQSNDLFKRHASTMKGVDEMVKLVVGLEKSKDHALKLDKECGTYTNYLVGQEPTDYILGKYHDAHGYTSLLNEGKATAFDRFLVDFSIKHPFFARLADAYTSLFYKRALFRSKLVLLVAIMESTAPTYSHFERPDASNIISLGIQLGLRLVRFGIALFLSILLFSPVHFFYSLIGRPSAEGIES